MGSPQASFSIGLKSGSCCWEGGVVAPSQVLGESGLGAKLPTPGTVDLSKVADSGVVVARSSIALVAVGVVFWWR